ncbi:Putative peptide transport system permease protein BRA1092/BS1330_II1084 [Geodia barretti]|uniref:Peptide transport system permease protein BRA1092/BS1330_II1084 n=1 Tax=Geodia barretti TaxID=519541 RepID=A0AA35VWY9_GEOBA|nr:Putative peptide transport system permease protein BRA1092/BS1330_II1084 [Geodia barretti]
MRRVIALLGIRHHADPSWIGFLIYGPWGIRHVVVTSTGIAHFGKKTPIQNRQLMLLPAAVIGFHDMAFTARVTRSAMLEVMREDYMRTARSKGLREWVVVGRQRQ